MSRFPRMVWLIFIAFGIGATFSRAELVIWGNTQVIKDRNNISMTNGYVTLWKDGGNGRIDAYGSGDDSQLNLQTTFSTNNPGYFYLVFDRSTVSGLSQGDNVFTRVFDGTYVVDIGFATVPPLLTTVHDGAPPSPSWIYQVGGTRPDGKSWPPLTPDSFLEFNQTTYDFGAIEVGVTVTQQLSVSAWYYRAVQYTNSMASPPWHVISSVGGTIQAPGMMNVTVECRPTVTGLQQVASGLDYTSIYGTSVDVPITLKCTGVMTDTDADGMSDSWELSHFGALTNSTGATMDSDGDGSPDVSEWIAGTDPMNSNSVLSGSVVMGTGDVFQIQWPSVGTASYTIRSASDLTGSFTDVVATAVIGTPPTNQITVPLPTHSQEFYRISVDRP